MKKIKLFATDIDGVWTDAKMYYTEKGDFMKAFSTYDGMAVQILRERKVPVAILTSEKSKIVLARAKKLKIKEVYIGENEKLKRMNYICKKMNIKINQVAYIGDDLNDLDLLKKVGISGAPSSSPIISKIKPTIVTQKKGGEGAFREFVDVILKKNLI
tara:strand:- start:209 stop:682 length:474 start_codon:yes stop_codon:yes gene_type:complete